MPRDLSLVSNFAALIFPPCCASCLRPLSTSGVPLCPACLNGVTPVTHPVCTVCGIPFSTGAGPDHVCGYCMKKPRMFMRARGMFVYGGTVRTLIHKLKFHGDTYALNTLVNMARGVLDCFSPPRGTVIIPVPLHLKRLRKRGFNQSQLLSEGIFTRHEVSTWLLERTRDTTPQMNLAAEERMTNVKGAFMVRKENMVYVQDRRFLVFDDIMTTGSTAEGAAAALLEAGAREVDVLALSRTLR